jgi:CRP/FNR family transcriptional regulator, dissimilatory nitrate respiration regulator
MSQNELLLNKTILLQELTSEDISLYLKEGRFKLASYNKNTIIHFEGEPCTKLEIIISGEIVVERLDEAGGLLIIAEFLSDDILGGNLLFSKSAVFPMTITAKKSSVIVSIEKELLFELFCKHPSFLRLYLEYVADHTAILGYKLKNHVGKSIRENLISFLEHESKVQDSKRIILTMTKKVLAEKLGVQRTSLSRELTKMKIDGLIIFDSESITILFDN